MGQQFLKEAMEFSVVILNQFVETYPTIEWIDWKDDNSKQMKSEGDHWAKATLSGTDIWNCLDTHQIDPNHLVQWRPLNDTLHKVSLPSRGR